MRRFTVLAVPLMMLLCVSTAQAAAIQVFSEAALGANDFIDWSQLGPELTEVASPYTTTSNLGRNHDISNTSGSFTNFQEGSLAAGDFAPNDWLLFTGDLAGNTAQSFRIDFQSAVAGVGTQIQSNAFGDFTAELRLFDAADNLIGGPFSVSSNNAGAGDDSNPFLGGTSDAVNIAWAVFAVTANTADLGLLVNRVLTTDTPFTPGVPEPATLGLVVLGALAAVRRRRTAK